MRDDYVSRKAVMESLTKEYNRKATRENGGLQLAWVEKAVNDVPPAAQMAPGRKAAASMGDLIGRQAAIDATWEEPSYTDALNALTEVRDKIRALPTVVEPQMDLIDTEGLDEEIRCEICRNPMHTSRGCDGNCTYDEKLYEKITQILDKRIMPLPSAQPEPEIIACGDCKHWICHDRRCGYWNHGVKPLEWCCHAERRTDGGFD